jgi:hypothetical protein
LQLARERIQHKAKFFQCDRAQQRLVSRLAEDDRRVPLALRKREMAFRYPALDRGSVSQAEGDAPFWLKFKQTRLLGRDQRVGYAAVYKEVDVRLFAVGPGEQALNVRKALAKAPSEGEST